MKMLIYVLKNEKIGDVSFRWDGKDYYVEPRIFGDNCILYALIDGVTITVMEDSDTMLVPWEWVKRTYPNEKEDLEKFERMMLEIRLGAKQTRAQKLKEN